jgi:hypothetical protein
VRRSRRQLVGRDGACQRNLLAFPSRKACSERAHQAVEAATQSASAGTTGVEARSSGLNVSDPRQGDRRAAEGRSEGRSAHARPQRGPGAAQRQTPHTAGSRPGSLPSPDLTTGEESLPLRPASMPTGPTRAARTRRARTRGAAASAGSGPRRAGSPTNPPRPARPGRVPAVRGAPGAGADGVESEASRSYAERYRALDEAGQEQAGQHRAPSDHHHPGHRSVRPMEDTKSGTTIPSEQQVATTNLTLARSSG